MENKLLFITQPGKLSRKDNTLFFENETIKKTIPIIGIEQIYCLAEISINSKLLQFLTEKKIIIHFFNYYGYYIGSYYPRETYISGKLLIKQVEHYIELSKRSQIAKNIVKQIGNNQIFVLRHYQRHGKDVKSYIDKIRNLIVTLEKTTTIEEILNHEGGMWNIFYQSFNKFLNPNFNFINRTKRPPKDPLNALISFGNSILYSYTLSKIYHTQLNPTISYLHEPAERRFSLALDLAENFKLLIVFPIIFDLINRKKIKIEKHFIKKLNYTLLNNEGRKIFLKAFNDKINQTIQHPTLKRKISYGSLIKLDAYKLIKHLLGEKEFIPFDLQNKI